MNKLSIKENLEMIVVLIIFAFIIIGSLVGLAICGFMFIYAGKIFINQLFGVESFIIDYTLMMIYAMILIIAKHSVESSKIFR